MERKTHGGIRSSHHQVKGLDAHDRKYKKGGKEGEEQRVNEDGTICDGRRERKIQTKATEKREHPTDKDKDQKRKKKNRMR